MGKNKRLIAHAKVRVNNDLIRHEMIDGEDHIVVPCSTMPPDIVMNGTLYPSGEVQKAAPTLEGTPSPLGHPKVEGELVSASNPRAANKYGVGAWNRAVTYTDKIHYEKVINVRQCMASPYGAQLIAALEKGDPIDTSVGLYCWVIVASGTSNGEHYSEIATDILFDHDAILLEEPGAATPDKGTGIYVNSQEKKKMDEENKGTIAMLANALNNLLKGNSEKQEPEKKEPTVSDGQESTQGGDQKPVDQSKDNANDGDLDARIEKAIGDKVEKAIVNALGKLSGENKAPENGGEEQQKANAAAQEQGHPFAFGLPSGTKLSTNSAEDEQARLARLPE